MWQIQPPAEIITTYIPVDRTLVKKKTADAL